MSVRINGVNYDTTIRNNQTNLGNPSADQSADYGVGIGTYHMANNPALYEPQRTNNFEFIVMGVDSLYRPGTNELITNGQAILRLSINNAPVPSFQQSTIDIRRGNTTLKYAGVPNFSEGSYTFNDYIGVETYNVLQAWQYLSYNVQTEKVGLASDYKKECYLIKYTPDYQPVYRWKMMGCWISNLTEDAMNNENNGKVNISCTIQYDKAMPDNNI